MLEREGESGCEGKTGSGEALISLWESGIKPRGVQSGVCSELQLQQGNVSGLVVCEHHSGLGQLQLCPSSVLGHPFCTGVNPGQRRMAPLVWGELWGSGESSGQGLG